MLGPTMEVVEEYQNYLRSKDAETGSGSSEDEVPQAEEQRFGGETHIREVALGGDCRDGTIETGQTFEARVVVRVAPTAQEEGVQIAMLILRNDMLRCYGVSTEMDGFDLEPLSDGEVGVRLVVEDLPLLAGEYSLQVILLDRKGVHVYDLWKGVSPFKVSHGTPETGLVRIKHRWEPL